MCEVAERKYKPVSKERLKEVETKLAAVEITSARIKAVNFVNMQSFDSVYSSYLLGEVYKINNIGYCVITAKSLTEITFVIIMHVNNVWREHIQDVKKEIKIYQGIYYDMFTGQEYIDKVNIDAYEPTYFKAIGDKDLVMKGKIYR